MNPHEMDVRRRDFFNENAETWLDTFYLDPATGKHDRYNRDFDRLFSHAIIPAGGTVLDVGCGCGVLVPYILERVGQDGSLYEVDYAENMIEVNRRLHDDSRITFIAQSVEDLDIPSGTVDTAICFSCFPHFQDKKRAVEVLGTALRTGGQLMIGHFGHSDEINDHHRKHECVKHDMLPQEAEMRALLGDAGFRIETFLNEIGFYCISAIKGD